MKQMSLNVLAEPKITNEFGKAIGDNARLQLFLRCAQTEIRKNPKLLECEQRSVLGALFSAAQLHLNFSGLGQAYLVPYFNSKKKATECQFQIGYRGYLDLFYRHHAGFLVEAEVVKEGDKFDFQFGTNKFINHQWGEKRGEVVKVYAIATIGNEKTFIVMSKDEIDEVKKLYAKTTNIWDKHYEAMAKKTACKRLCKYLPLSIEMQSSVSLDETTRYYQPEIATFDTEPDRTDFDEIGKPEETHPEKQLAEPGKAIIIDKKLSPEYVIFRKQMVNICTSLGEKDFFTKLGKLGFEHVEDLETASTEDMDKVLNGMLEII